MASALALLRSLRPEQWLKNGFVLAPLVFSGQVMDGGAWSRSLLAVGCFSAAASAGYLLNDLRDRESDRRHPLKRLRPVAAGRVGTLAALVAAAVLLALAGAAAVALGGWVPHVVAGYVLLVAMYSMVLKELVFVDVLVIAAGFVLRVVGGAAAIRVPVSSWLLLCAFLLALYLGLGKRRAELVLLGTEADGHRAVLGEYSLELVDHAIAVVLGATVVAYSLYTVAPTTVAKVGSEGLMATVPVVLYGLLRYLFLLHRQEQGGSPGRTLLVDRPLLACVVVWLAIAAVVVGTR